MAPRSEKTTVAAPLLPNLRASVNAVRGPSATSAKVGNAALSRWMGKVAVSGVNHRAGGDEPSDPNTAEKRTKQDTSLTHVEQGDS